MSVYVDGAIHALRGKRMCHMFSPDLAELHAMAQRIGMERRWFQDLSTMPVAMAAIIQGRPDKLRRIQAMADPSRAFAPLAHVSAWLAEQGFSQVWNW